MSPKKKTPPPLLTNLNAASVLLYLSATKSPISPLSHPITTPRSFSHHLSLSRWQRSHHPTATRMTKKKQQSRHMLSRQQNAKSRLNHRQRRNDSRQSDRQAGGRSELLMQYAARTAPKMKDVTKKKKHHKMERKLDKKKDD
jgi:hypothetical protein